MLQKVIYADFEGKILKTASKTHEKSKTLKLDQIFRKFHLKFTQNTPSLTKMAKNLFYAPKSANWSHCAMQAHKESGQHAKSPEEDKKYQENVKLRHHFAKLLEGDKFLEPMSNLARERYRKYKDTDLEKANIYAEYIVVKKYETRSIKATSQEVVGSPKNFTIFYNCA